VAKKKDLPYTNLKYGFSTFRYLGLKTNQSHFQYIYNFFCHQKCRFELQSTTEKAVNVT